MNKYGSGLLLKILLVISLFLLYITGYHSPYRFTEKTITVEKKQQEQTVVFTEYTANDILFVDKISDTLNGFMNQTLSKEEALDIIGRLKQKSSARYSKCSENGTVIYNEMVILEGIIKLSDNSHDVWELLLQKRSVFDAMRSNIHQYQNDHHLISVNKSDDDLNGQYLITMMNHYLSMSYSIGIQQGQIRNAYNPHSSSSFYAITNEKLTIDSPYQATYSIMLNKLTVYLEKYLRSSIQDGEIRITYN